MDNPVSFDLNLAIQHWRENLAQSPAFRSENLNELESHLRDSIATLQTRGLSAEESFMVAARRVGNTGSLEKEFGKVNGKAVWLDRMIWILAGVQISMIVSIAYSTVATAVNGAAGRLVQLWPGFGEAAFLAAVILLPPGFIVAAGVVGWKLLRTSHGTIRSGLETLLGQPAKLALGLFLACVGLKLFADCLLGYWIYPTLYANFPRLGLQFVLGNSLTTLPQYACCAALTLLVARKRLRASRA